MADKTTTLKTKKNDNVYPNIIGDNRDNAIVDSAHINHTLTSDHKINFRLDTNVSGLIFNSLQKPTGLTKTKLVGVGTNGQENIEIGDNLTLANGKLSATGGGGGVPVVEITSTSGDEYTIGEAQTTNFVLNVANIYYINMDYIGGAYLGGDVSVIDTGSDTFLQIYTFSGRGTTITKSEKILALSYLFNDYAIFTEGMQSEEILPYDTSADEGKVLTVRNGQLVWETPSASANILPLPADASTSTYVLKAVNGVIKWVKES